MSSRGEGKVFQSVVENGVIGLCTWRGGGLATRICSVLGARLGVGTGCCRGWEGFLARGGVPSAGGVSHRMMLQTTGEVPLPARRRSR